MPSASPQRALATLLVALAIAGCGAPQEATEPESEPENVPAVATQVGPEPLVAPQEEPNAEWHALDAHHVVPTLDVPWQDAPASLAPPAHIAILSGDPAQEGAFVFQLELPSGYRIPPHTHPGWERVVVISGTGYLGMGTTMDDATELAPGSYFELPPGMVHWFHVGPAQVVLQLHGQGPWGIDYVDPADDPRTQPDR